MSPCFLRLKFTIHLSRLSRSQHLWCYVLSAMLLLRVFPGDHLTISPSDHLIISPVSFYNWIGLLFFFSKKMLLDSENLVNFPTWQLQTNRCTAMPWSSFIFCNLHLLNHLQNSTQQSWTRWCGEIVAALKLSDWLACGWRTDLTFWINNLTNLGNLTLSKVRSEILAFLRLRPSNWLDSLGRAWPRVKYQLRTRLISLLTANSFWQSTDEELLIFPVMTF